VCEAFNFGFFASDAALEDKILAFFAQRATLALSNVRHLQDPTDPTSLALDAESHADFLAQLRFSTHTLTDNQVRRYSSTPNARSLSHSPSAPPPSFTQSPYPPRSLVRDERTHPHRLRLVVSHSTCPPLSSSPPANSFVLGPAVINTHIRMMGVLGLSM
jgi:hypothetical protein